MAKIFESEDADDFCCDDTKDDGYRLYRFVDFNSDLLSDQCLTSKDKTEHHQEPTLQPNENSTKTSNERTENTFWIKWFSKYKSWLKLKHWECKEELLAKVDKFIDIIPNMNIALFTTGQLEWDGKTPFPIIRLYTSDIGLKLFFSHSFNSVIEEKATMYNQCIILYSMLDIEVLNMPFNSIVPEDLYRGTIITPYGLELLERMKNAEHYALKTFTPAVASLISTSESRIRAINFALKGNAKAKAHISDSRPVLWRYHFVSMEEKLVREFERFCPKSRLLSSAYDLQNYSVYPNEREWILKVCPFYIDSIATNDDFSEITLLVLDRYLHICDNERDNFAFWIMQNYCFSKYTTSKDFAEKAREGISCLRKDVFSMETMIPEDISVKMNNIYKMYDMLTEEAQVKLWENKWAIISKDTSPQSKRFQRLVAVFNSSTTHANSYNWMILNSKIHSVEDIAQSSELKCEEILLQALEITSQEQSLNAFDSNYKKGYHLFKKHYEQLEDLDKLDADFDTFLKNPEVEKASQYNPLLSSYMSGYYLRLIILKGFWRVECVIEKEKYNNFNSYYFNYVHGVSETIGKTNIFMKYKNICLSQKHRDEDMKATFEGSQPHKL